MTQTVPAAFAMPVRDLAGQPLDATGAGRAAFAAPRK
jgi:hypothetical protein